MTITKTTPLPRIGTKRTDREYVLIELKEFRTECYYDKQGHPISFGLFVNEEYKGAWIDVLDCYRQYDKYYKKKKNKELENEPS